MKSLDLFHKKTPRFEGFYVGLLGLEPRKTAPKTVVLPLHHRPALLLSECKFKINFSLYKFILPFYEKKIAKISKQLQKITKPVYNQCVIKMYYFSRK